MVNKKIMLTPEGKKKYEEELYKLKNIDMPAITQAIKEAKEQGDLSENADYDAARRQQGETNARIKYLEQLLINSEILENNSTDTVGLGSTVKLEFLDDDLIETYLVVSRAEADPLNGKISNECELGKAIIGHRENDTVVVEGKFSYQVKIIEIIKE